MPDVPCLSVAKKKTRVITSKLPLLVDLKIFSFPQGDLHVYSLIYNPQASLTLHSLPLLHYLGVLVEGVGRGKLVFLFETDVLLI